MLTLQKLLKNNIQLKDKIAKTYVSENLSNLLKADLTPIQKQFKLLAHALNEISNHPTTAASFNKIKAILSGQSPELAQLQAISQQQPSLMSTWINSIIANIKQQLLIVAANKITSDWNNEVLPYYSQQLGNTYPFNMHAKKNGEQNCNHRFFCSKMPIYEICETGH